MTFSEYGKYDGLGLAELVRKKKVSPAELVEEAISRIETHNPKLNAVVYKLYERARAAAQGKLPNGPFQGVPFLMKDLAATLEAFPPAVEINCGKISHPRSALKWQSVGRPLEQSW